MKALVVGYGSIGKRRAKDLTELGVEVVTTDPVTTELKDPLAAIREHAPGNLVVISSPSSEHTWQTMQAIGAGALAVMVEKPPAFNSGDWGLVMGLAEKRKIPVVVGFNYRFHPIAEYLRDTKPPSLAFLFADDVLAWPSFGYIFDARYGGILMISIIHSIDLALHILGLGRVVNAACVPMAALVEIQHASGNTLIVGTWFGPPNSNVNLHTINPDESMHSRMMEAFVHLAETGDYGHLCTAEQALSVMQIIDEAR